MTSPYARSTYCDIEIDCNCADILNLLERPDVVRALQLSEPFDLRDALNSNQSLPQYKSISQEGKVSDFRLSGLSNIDGISDFFNLDANADSELRNKTPTFKKESSVFKGNAQVLTSKDK